MVTVIAVSCGASNPGEGFGDVDDTHSFQEVTETGDPVDQHSGDVADLGDDPTEAPSDMSTSDVEEDAAEDAVEDLAEDAPDSDTPSEDSVGDSDESTDIEVADHSDVASDSSDLADETVDEPDTESDPEVTEDVASEADEDGSSLAPVRLSFANAASDSIEIRMTNDVAIKAYSFIASGVSLIGAGGGRTEDAGINNITAEGTYVAAFALDGSSIPPGEGVLIILEFTATSPSICLGDFELSNESDLSVEVAISPECHTF